MSKQITSSQKVIGIASLLLVGLLFGLSGVMAKYLSESLSALQVTEYRFIGALLTALLAAAVFRKKLQFNKYNKRFLVPFLFTLPISAIFFTLAIFNTSVALAVFSFAISSLLASFVLGRIFFNEHIHTYKQLSLILMTVAILVFTNPFGESVLSIGFVFGILSGLIHGATASFQKMLSGESDKLSLITLQSATSALMLIIILLFTQEPVFIMLSAFDWLIAFLFGATMLAISYLFLVGFKYVNLGTGSILVSSELLFGPLFAFLVLSENLGAQIVIGGILTALAAIFANIAAPKEVKTPSSAH